MAVLLSGALHAALLAGWMLQRPEPAPPPTPIVEVELLRPERPRERPRDIARPEPQAASASPLRPTTPERRPATARLPQPQPRYVPAGPTTPPPTRDEAPPPAPVAPSPAPARGLPPDLAAVGRALRAADCDRSDGDAGRARERCRDRLGPVDRMPLPPTTAERHAREERDDARYKANRRLGETVRDPLVAQCAGSGLCHSELPKGMPFGRVPHASPVIPPSTLRGDDDALKPKPKP